MSFTGALLKPSEKGERRPTASRSIAKGSRYEILKDKIRTWWDDRFKIGEYLKEIKDAKLYKSEYGTFEEFSEGEFGIKQAYAYRLIEASDVRLSLGNSTIVEKLERPSQAHALAPVPVEQRAEVLTKVAERGPVTARAIRETARTARAPKSPKVQQAVILDKTGYAIPESILGDWQRAERTANGWLIQISQVRTELKSHLDEQDLIVASLTNTTLSDLNNAYTSITCALPYAVCTSCQGHQRKKCNLCKGRGFLDKFSWKSFVPAETKKLRGGK